MRHGLRGGATAYVAVLAVLLLLHMAAAAASRNAAHRRRGTYVVHEDSNAPPSPSSLHPMHHQRIYIVHAPLHNKAPSAASLHSWHSDILAAAAASAAANSSSSFPLPKLLYTYSYAFHGFAALLSDHHAHHLRLHPHVSRLHKDERLAQPHTTRTPYFLHLTSSTDGAAANANSDGPLWSAAHRGRNVVVGFLDTGIWPEHPSFSDTLLNGSAPPPHWRGSCQSYPPSFIAASACNRKLIGARAFFEAYDSYYGINDTIEFRSPRDSEGHGTHTASTAVGSPVSNASFYGFASGTASGVAPLARLAVYKVCWQYGCLDSDILAGFDAAIADGVDIVSVSLGGFPLPYEFDLVAVGSFAASKYGILTVASAGNNGPFSGLVTNVAPWILTVAASTIDRDFPVSVTLGNGETYVGASLYRGPGLGNRTLPLVYAGDAVANVSGSFIDSLYASYCENVAYLNTSLIAGKIVLCEAPLLSFDTANPAVKGLVIKEAGGVGIILATDDLFNGEQVIALPDFLPAASVGAKAASKIREYIATTPNPTAVIDSQNGATALGTKPAPALAAFSSRGPNSITPEIMKPDVTAPGVNVLAAWPAETSPTGYTRDERRVEFNFASGTSMSCPHVAGLAALLKAANPSWSPAAIKSALMTTATTGDNTGGRIRDTFNGKRSNAAAYGSGHVNSNAALDAGLVYDITTEDYVDFLCGLYTNSSIFQYVSPANGTLYNYTYGSISSTQYPNCSSRSTAAKRPIDLNYPSFGVVFNNSAPYSSPASPFTVSTQRTLINVSPILPATYTATVISPLLLNVSISPATLTFSYINQNLSYAITFTFASNNTDFVSEASFLTFGSVTWSDGLHNITSPISFAIS